MGNSHTPTSTTSPNATPVHDSQGFAPQTAPEALTDQGFVPQVAQELVAFPCLDTQSDGNRSYASPSIFRSSGLSPPDVEHFGNMQGVSKDGRRGVFEVPIPPQEKDPTAVMSTPAAEQAAQLGQLESPMDAPAGSKKRRGFDTPPSDESVGGKYIKWEEPNQDLQLALIQSTMEKIQQGDQELMALVSELEDFQVALPSQELVPVEESSAQLEFPFEEGWTTGFSSPHLALPSSRSLVATGPPETQAMRPPMAPSMGVTMAPSMGVTMAPSMGVTMAPSMGAPIAPAMGATMAPSMGIPMDLSVGLQMESTMGSQMDLSKGPSSGPESGAGLSGGEGGPQEQPEDDIFPWTLPQVYAYFESQMGQIQTNVEGILFQEMGMLRQHITDEKILMVQQCQKLVEDLKSAQGTSGGAIDVAHIQKEVEKKLTSGLALLEDLLERKVGLLEAKLTADLHSGIGHLSGQFSLLQGQVAQDARAREQAWAVHMGRLERETLARHVSLQDLVKRIARSMMDKMQQLILQTPPPPPPPCHYAAMGRPEVELRRSMPSCQPRFEQSLQEVQDLFARNVSISQMPTSTCSVQNAQKFRVLHLQCPRLHLTWQLTPLGKCMWCHHLLGQFPVLPRQMRMLFLPSVLEVKAQILGTCLHLFPTHSIPSHFQ